MILLLQFLFLSCHLAHGRSGKKFLIEGDILVTPRIANVILSQEQSNKKKSISTHNDIRVWKFGLIPYRFSHEIDESLKNMILKAFEVLKSITCLRFQKATSRDKDYVEFTVDEGCYSSIGRQGGRQVISLGEGCESVGHVLHELMHTIGFFHEQSRIDRDLYVKILWWNIADGAIKNFAAYTHGGLEPLDTQYDIHSILHYENKAFTKNGGNTIEALENPREELGQDHLSVHDVEKINRVYKCMFRWGR